MKLAEILAISGQPGLYRFVAQSRGGIIVESLADSKRMIVSGNAKVSSLNDIAIFTVGEDMPLGRVFTLISEKTDGKECCSHKETDENIKAAMKSYVPDYDTDRVRLSDMKKLFSWYNILVGVGMNKFIEIEEGADAEKAAETTETAETESKPAKKGGKKAKTTEE